MIQVNSQKNTKLAQSRYLKKKLTIKNVSYPRLSRLTSREFEEENFSHSIEPIFSHSSSSLTINFMNTLRNLKSKSIIYLALVLRQKDFKILVSNLFDNSDKILQEVSFKNCTNIYFKPSKILSFHNANVLLLYYPFEQIQNILSSQDSKLLQFLFIFPQLIIIDEQAFTHTTFTDAIKNSQLTNQHHQITTLLKSRQTRFIYSPQIHNNVDFTEQHTLFDLSKSIIQDIIWIGLKKNSFRCLNQKHRIYSHIFNMLMSNDLTEFEKSNISFKNQAISTYLNSEIYEFYDDLKLKLKNKFPINQQKLINILQKQEQNIVIQLKKCLMILDIEQNKKQQIMKSTQANFEMLRAQMLELSRLQAEKYDINLINSLSEVFEQTINSRSKSKNKDRIHILTEDFVQFLTKYSDKAIQFSSEKQQSLTNGQFTIFNRYLQNHKLKYFKLISTLQENQSQKQLQNPHEIQLTIDLKSRMLSALERQIKILQQKKLQSENENQEIKKKVEHLYDEVKFQSDNSEKFSIISFEKDQDSIKTLADHKKYNEVHFLIPDQEVKSRKKIINQKIASQKSIKDQKLKKKEKQRSCCCKLF